MSQQGFVQSSVAYSTLLVNDMDRKSLLTALSRNVKILLEQEKFGKIQKWQPTQPTVRMATWPGTTEQNLVDSSNQRLLTMATEDSCSFSGQQQHAFANIVTVFTVLSTIT